MRKISIKQLWSSGRSLQPTNLPSCLPATHAPCPASPVVGLTPPPSVQKPRIIDQFAPTRPVKPYTDVFVERETTGGTKGRPMGGFFGAASHRDVVMDVFFGVDYHSHLGTRRAGMIFHDSEDQGFQREIHSIENTPFRTRFEDDLPGFHGQQRHRLHQRHRPAAAAGTLASGHVRHHHGRRHQQRRGAGGARTSREAATPVHGHELGQREHHGAGRRPHQPEGRLRVGHQVRPGRHRRFAHAAHHDQRRAHHRGARQDGTPARARRQGRRTATASRSSRSPTTSWATTMPTSWDRREIVRVDARRLSRPSAPAGEQDEDLRVPVGVLRLSQLQLRRRERRGHALPQRRHHGARRGANGACVPDVDYVAGVPDSGVPHAIGYSTECGMRLSARPFIKYTPTWPRSFMPVEPGRAQPRGEDEADSRARAHPRQEAAFRRRLHRARHAAARDRGLPVRVRRRRKCTCARPARPSCSAAST